MSNSFLVEAVGVAKNAIETDHKHRNYSVAYGLYRQAIDLFHQAISHEEDPNTKQFIINKIDVYIKRIKELQPVADEEAHVDSLFSDNNFASIGISLITQAILLDQDMKYNQALQLYQRAVEFFMAALKYEKNNKAKQLLREKVESFLNRAEEIKNAFKDGLIEPSNDNLSFYNDITNQHSITFSRCNIFAPYAAELLNQAAEFEAMQQLSQASILYHEAIQYYTHAVKYEDNDYLRGVWRSQIVNALKREDEIKNILESKATPIVSDANIFVNTTNRISNQQSSNYNKSETNNRKLSSLNSISTMSSIEVMNSITIPSTESTYTATAINLAHQAIDMDNLGEFKKALQLYEEALQYFTESLKCEENETVKVIVHNRIARYLKRVDELALALNL